MMKELETGKNKIQKICDVLRSETLEPAKQEAREIIENAHIQAAKIIEDAKKKGNGAIETAEKEIGEKMRVFQSSLQISCKQGIELLKQKIEEQLFNRELSDLVLKETKDPEVIASILSSLIKAMEAQGVEDEFVAVIPKTISARSINALLVANILQKLQGHSVTVGDFSGGVQVQLKGKQITIDMTDAALKELVALYIRRDFRDLVFNA
jgi:V/A-type H+-transporting ATPase subunit E